MIFGLADDAGVSGRLVFRGMSGYDWFLTTLAWVGVLLAAGLTLGGAVEANGTTPLVTGLLCLVITVPIAVFTFPLFRPVVLTDSELRIPVGRRTKVISLEAVAGLGLAYRWIPGNTRARQGWILQVWTTGGERTQIDRFIATSLSRPRTGDRARSISFTRDPALPLPHENADNLKATFAGRVASHMYDWIQARQGTSGPLATQALEKSIRFEKGSVPEDWAWWSPDGTMKRLHP